MSDFEVTIEVAVRSRGQIGDRLRWTTEVELEAGSMPQAALEALRQAPGDLAVDLPMPVEDTGKSAG